MGKAKEVLDLINEVIFGRDSGMESNCVCPECGNETSYASPVACSSRSCTVCGSSTLTHPDYDVNDDGTDDEDQDSADADTYDYDFPYEVGHDDLIHDSDFLPKEGRPTGEYVDYRESYKIEQDQEESSDIGLNNIGWGIGTGLSRADTPFNRFSSYGPPTRKLVFTGPKATALKLAATSASHESPPVGTPGTAPIGYSGTNDTTNNGLRCATCSGDNEPENCVCDQCGYSIENTTGQDCSVIPCPKCGAL